MGVYPIRTVARLTGFSPRQVRYYEEMKLISPCRSKGNQRLFSAEDVDLLIAVKVLLDKGLTLQGIRSIFQSKPSPSLPMMNIRVPKLNHGALIQDLMEGRAVEPDLSEENQQTLYQFLLRRWERQA